MTNVRKIQLETGRGDDAGIAAVELWVTTDDGQTWRRAERFDGRPKTLPFEAPADGRYGFRMVYVDKAEGTTPAPLPGTAPESIVIVDTRPPTVELIRPNGQALYRKGAGLAIEWVAADDHLGIDPVALEISPDRGTRWMKIADGVANNGKYFYDLPAESSDGYLIRVSVRDRAGNVGSDVSDAPFTVDGLPPAAQIVGPATSSTHDVTVKYLVAEAGGGAVARVELWAREKTPGGRWRRVAEDEDRTSPVEVRLLDGAYELQLVAVDGLGNSSAAPQEGVPGPHELLVDATPPVVELLEAPSEVVAADTGVALRWAVRDSNPVGNGVRIEWHDGTVWREAARGLPPEGKPYVFKTPAGDHAGIRLRVVAEDVLGNDGAAVTGVLRVDAHVPVAELLGPRKASRTPVPLEYALQNVGAAPVTSVVLYVSADSGKTWEIYGKDDDAKSPVMFDRPEGRYDLTAVASTALGEATGRRQAPPTPGSPGQLTLELDAQGPRIAFHSMNEGKTYAGGVPQDLVYEVRDVHPSEKGLRITYSDSPAAGFDHVLVEGGDTRDGRYVWKEFPKKSGTYRLKIEAEDGFGNRAMAISEPFLVDADPPVWNFPQTTRRVSRGTPFAIAFDIQDVQSGRARAELWERSAAVKDSWKRISTVETFPSDFTVSGRDPGVYEYFLVTADRIGNVSAAPTAETAGALRVEVVDEPPPASLAVRLKSFKGGRAYRGGSRHGLFFDAAGSGRIEDGTVVEWSEEEGPAAARTRAWRAIPRIELTRIEGGYLWTLPAVNGKTFRVRVTVRDREGKTAFDESESDFTIDSVVPAIAANGPSFTRTLPAEIDYKVLVDPPSGIQSILIHYSRDEGKHWYPGGWTVPGKPLYFKPDPPAPGAYWLALIGVSGAGIETPYPANPHLVLTYRPTGAAGREALEAPLRLTDGSLTVRLLSDVPRVLRGGETLSIAWETEAKDLPSNSAILRVTANGDPPIVVRGLPATGRYNFKVPLQDYYNCQVEVKVLGAGQAYGVARSTVFSIDGTAPRFEPGFAPVSRRR